MRFDDILEVIRTVNLFFHCTISIVYITRKMVPICQRASSFLNLCQNNKHEQIQNQNAVAFQHLLVSKQKIVDFCQCAGITHCLTAKVSNSQKRL